MNFHQFLNQNKNLNSTELEVLLLYVTKKPKKFFILNPDYQFSKLQILRLKRLVSKLNKNYPLAYLVKNQNFYGLNFYVDKNVLIPRPETEILVDATKNIKWNTALDLCTGSGCIASSLLSINPNATIIASDVSRSALKVAAKNLKQHNKTFNLLKSNLLDKIPKNTHFDLIITNPPYVKNSDKIHMSLSTLKYEPKIALFAGEDGMEIYYKIFNQIQEKQITFNYFLGESGFNQEKQIASLLETHFSGKYTLFKDLAGITRFFKIDNSHAR